MKRIFTVLLSLSIVSMTLWAQDIDRSFVFVDENGTEVVDGATIVRNLAQYFDEGTEFINAGLSIQKTSAASSDYVRLHYAVEQIDNGSYQLCFPTTCNMQTLAGNYETSIGQLMGDIQDIQSEWFPTANGTCVVTLTIEILTRQGSFPPSYVHKAYGPSVTVQFVKSSSASDDYSPYVKLDDGVYLDGTTLYICSGVTSLGDLQVNPSEVYSFAAAPPTCTVNTFTGYSAVLHMPAASYGAYFTADYWSNFLNMSNDAIEPTDINLNNTDIELIVGNTFVITATVVPNNASAKDLEWRSSNPIVATVCDGTVTALATGECDIIASCLDKQAVCHVVVTEPISVTLDQTEVTIEQTKQVTLTATVSPESSASQNVTWSTTDASIATVNNGVVEGVVLGECDIIASYLDKQAVCHVSVIETTIYITLDKDEAKLLPNHSLTLTPTMSPLITELKVASSDPSVAAARLANGIVQVVGLAEGTTMIIVGSIDGKAVPDTCVVTVYTDSGDINCDGYVNISDVTILIDFLLSGNQEGISTDNADTDKDGKINISDVTTLIDYLLSGLWPWSLPHDGDWVDLGLPSGTLWATMNVGASKPEDYGDYFAWGETTSKDEYSWSTYKWCNGRENTLTKYCLNNLYGAVDNKNELDPEDDAAFVNWGALWRMPSLEQQKELFEQCIWTWTTQNGVNGRLLIGPNGNALFLPAAGYCWGNWFDNAGYIGDYWSRTLGPDDSGEAYELYFYLENVVWGRSCSRYDGFPIRAVRVSQN